MVSSCSRRSRSDDGPGLRHMFDRLILVTGAGGFLGRAVCEVLRRRGLPFVGAVRPGGRGIELAEAHACDLAEPASLQSLLDAVRPGAIINCAAIVEFRPDTLKMLFPVNVDASATLAGWSAVNDAAMVQISTSAIHGSHTERIDRQTPNNYESDYVQTKLLAEQAIAASGCRATMIRFGGIYGRNGPAHLGLNRAIDAAATRVRPTIVGSGRARRNYIHVRDAAEVAVVCHQNRIAGVHLSAGPEVLSIETMLQKVCDRYLPGEKPDRIEGQEARDQIIESSSLLPRGLPMTEQLAQD